MKKTFIAGSLLLLLIAGGAYAMDSGSSNGTANNCMMASGQTGGSMDHGSMSHDEMANCPMKGQAMPMDHSKMHHDGMNQNETGQGSHDHTGQGGLQ
jgi:pentapeptide MXKDX repeat protein